MQLKRIFVTLLVAVMMISMAVLAVSAAETENNTFVVAVDAVDNEGNLAVTPGETVDVAIIVTNNPGVCYTTVLVTYDADALECVDQEFTSGDLYTVKLVQSIAGRTVIITDINSSKDVAATGTLVTLTFKVKDTFAGDKAEINIESVDARNAKNEVIIGVGSNGSDACSHSDVKVEAGVAPTCKDEGKTEAEICKICGEVVKAAEVIPATGEHTPGEAATCTTAQTCTVCGEELAPIADHTIVAIGTEIPATCTSTGLTAGEKCSVCEKIITAPATIEKLAHTEETIPAVAATCTATGLTEGKKCSVCGFVTVAQTATEKAAHTEETIPAVAATCTTTGLTEGKKCSVCGFVIVAQTTVNTTAHTEVAIEAVAATCTAAGSTEGKKCSVCGAITVAPTVVQPTGHTLEEIPAVEPTYSEAGATAGSKCTVCGEIIDAPDEIPAKSLAWLWVLIVCVVVVGGGATAFYFLFLKKRLAK